MRSAVSILGIALLASSATLAGNFEFVVIGDTRPRFESESFRPFEKLISRMNGLHPALVINLGDLIYGYGPASKEKQWEKYAAVVRTIAAPYYQVPGNHDTHSKEARKVYGRRFGKFYEAFDYGDCHFVLLDNTENQSWGCLGPAQLNWLKQDLKETQSRSVFVFLHFPIWEPERIIPEYYKFWLETLHPLFRESRVRAVFAGHYHTYGPTREFDGIRYFITGGGGAELRPEYRKSGGEYHFMKLRVSDGLLGARIVTENGEMTDPEADVMGGLQFAAHNVSRIGIKSDQELKRGVTFSVSIKNPYPDALRGEAQWLLDVSAFAIEPQTIAFQIPVGQTRKYDFNLRALQSSASLQSLPRLQFNVVSGERRHRFHREIRFIHDSTCVYHAISARIDGELSDWPTAEGLKLGSGIEPYAELRSYHDKSYLYLAVIVPAIEADEAKESGFSDELQIGIARRLGENDFAGDALRFGYDSDSSEVRDRTPGHKVGSTLSGAKSASRRIGRKRVYEIALPLAALHNVRATPGNSVLLDLAFPVPPSQMAELDPIEPGANTFSYRIRYGSDSLVPVHFVQLNLERVR